MAPTEPAGVPAQREPHHSETGPAGDGPSGWPPAPDGEDPERTEDLRPGPDRPDHDRPGPASGSPGPDPAAPPGRGGEPPTPPTGGSGRPRVGNREKLIAAVVAVVVLLGLAGTAHYLHERSLRTVDLLGLDTPGDDPFGPNLVLDGSVAPTVRLEPAAGRSPVGDLDGLYLDTTGSGGCTRADLDTQLTADPAFAGAWGTPLGVAGDAAPGYLATLTPARLRADTRITAYGYADGAAQPHPAILQAGTAVLVDERGVPRVRCADSGPLSGPRPVADPYYGGSDWDGFDPATVVEVRPAAAAIREFGLVDPAGRSPFRRPASTSGDHDVAQLPGTGRFAAFYLLAGPQTACQGLQNCALSLQGRLLPQFSGCPDACTVTDASFLAIPVTLSRDRDSWKASGNVPDGHGLSCQNQPSPSVFQVSFTPTRSAVVDGVWQATEVRADYQMQSAAAGGCSASLVGWSMTGPAG